VALSDLSDLSLQCVGSHLLSLKPEQRASMNAVDDKKNVLNLVVASLNHITAQRGTQIT